MIKEAVEVASQRLEIEARMEMNKGPGRPSNNPVDLAKTVLMQQYFGVSNRVTAGLVLLFKEKMGIEDIFSYKMVERAYENPLVTLILKEVFRMTQKPVKEKEKVFIPDGTGLPRSMKLNWENDQGKKYSSNPTSTT